MAVGPWWTLMFWRMYFISKWCCKFFCLSLRFVQNFLSIRWSSNECIPEVSTIEYFSFNFSHVNLIWFFIIVQAWVLFLCVHRGTCGIVELWKFIPVNLFTFPQCLRSINYLLSLETEVNSSRGYHKELISPTYCNVWGNTSLVLPLASSTTVVTRRSLMQITTSTSSTTVQILLLKFQFQLRIRQIFFYVVFFVVLV